MLFATNKKSIFSLFLEVGLSVIALFLMLFVAISTVSAASPSCYNIDGHGTAELFNGVPNSGVVYFETTGTPLLTYEACAENTNTVNPGDGPYIIKGWSWDDNLGWISYYCGDEDNNVATPRTNLGLPCGSFDHELMMDGVGGADPGRLNGYAWGDNTGWINFSCVGGVDSLGQLCGGVSYTVDVEPLDPACYGLIYSTLHPACSPTTKPANTVRAWSDNVGWLNFEGVQFPWMQLARVEVDIDFEILNSAGTDANAVTKNDAPIADGTDAFDTLLHVVYDYDGLPLLTGGSDYTFTVEVDWAEDSVDLNQTDAANGDYSACYGTSGACANAGVNKPDMVGHLTDAANYSNGPASDAFLQEVMAYAPTSGMNGYDSNGDGTIEYSYEDFKLPEIPPFNAIPENNLVLDDVRVSAVHNVTGMCAFGTGAGCATTSVMPVAQYDLEFVPAIEVNDLRDSPPDEDSISASQGIQRTLTYSTECRGSLIGCSGNLISMQLGVTSPFKLVYNGVDCTSPDLFNLPFSSVGSSFPVTPVFGDDGVGGCLTSAPGAVDDAYAYSTIAYSTSGKNVSYYSNKLPRVEGSLVVNPVGEYTGNIYSTGVTNPQENKEIRSIGELHSKWIRDQIWPNVNQLVRGKEKPLGTAEISGWGGATTGFTIAGNVEKFVNDLLGAPKVYYFGGDVTIGSGFDWSGERTIIVDGGDLFIDEDIYKFPSVGHKLGIIVLKSYETGGSGGNIYIHPDVTNIQANIYTDKHVFSYDGTHANLNAVGEPIWVDETARYNALLNQLLIEGTLASENTIGGANANPPILGDGTEVSLIEGVYTANPTGKSRARLYDLNFLRYYGLVFERYTAGACIGDAIEQNTAGVCPGDAGYDIVAKPVSEGGDLVPTSGGDAAEDLDPLVDFAAVNVIFDPPTATLPGFTATGEYEINIIP